jgi:hypothetical protein
MVVPRGDAPRSLAYQASALLLSYETMKNESRDTLANVSRNDASCVNAIRIHKF